MEVELKSNGAEPEQQKEGQAGGDTRVPGGREQDLGAAPVRGDYDPGVSGLVILRYGQRILGVIRSSSAESGSPVAGVRKTGTSKVDS